MLIGSGEALSCPEALSSVSLRGLEVPTESSRDQPAAPSASMFPGAAARPGLMFVSPEEVRESRKSVEEETGRRVLSGWSA